MALVGRRDELLRLRDRNLAHKHLPKGRYQLIGSYTPLVVRIDHVESRLRARSRNEGSQFCRRLISRQQWHWRRRPGEKAQ
jgi:hypothetical protein